MPSPPDIASANASRVDVDPADRVEWHKIVVPKDAGNAPLRQPVGASVAVIACGAIAQHCNQLIERRGWPVDVYPLPPLLHNRPEQIAAEVEPLARRLLDSYETVAIGYADCGTYGALDEVCSRLGLQRLPGLHCYDVFAGPTRIEALLSDQPGTYLLTDFLVRSFGRTVLHELGLDRFPELRETYFGNYTRIVWLAQQRTPELEARAQQAATVVGLPLTILEVGTTGLESELAHLVIALM